MSNVNILKLQDCFNSLWKIIAERQAVNPDMISFKSGVIFDEEGYKYDILRRAEKIIHSTPWEEPGIIGSGKIASMALELLAIRPNDGDQQNLVDYRDIMFFADQTFSAYSKDIEKALYSLYVKNEDKEAFNMLSRALNKKYALISYFFFLKDSKHYQVVRPKNFAERFPMIGAHPQCTLNCSWENYQKYLSVLQEVYNFLTQKLNEDITLTDAHSFVWMLWMLSSR